MAVVIGQEDIVAEAAGYFHGGRIDAVCFKQAGLLGFFDEIGVEPEHDIGLRRFAFELEAGEEGDAIGDTDEFDRAGAGLFKCFLYLGAWAPFGNKALIGVDGECLVGSGRRQGKSGGQDCCGKAGAQEYG